MFKPVANKVIELKERERLLNLHEKRIQNARGLVDHSRPKTYSSRPIAKTKKDLLSEMKFDDIERENQYLLKKITNIMQRDANPKRMQRSSTAMSIASEPRLKSLNYEQRKNDIMKIMNENQYLMQKITNTKSHYSIKHWEDDRKNTERYIAAISDYRFKDMPPTKTLINKNLWEQSEKHLGKLSGRNQGGDKSSLQGSTDNLGSPHTGVRVVHRTTRRIGQFNYSIEIRLEGGYLRILIENQEKTDRHYEVEFLQEEGQRLLREECNSEYSVLLDRIKVDDRTRSVYFKRNDFGADTAQNQSQDRKIRRVVHDTSKVYKVSYLHEDEQPSTFTLPAITERNQQSKRGIDNADAKEKRDRFKTDENAIDEDENENQLSQIGGERSAMRTGNKDERRNESNLLQSTKSRAPGGDAMANSNNNRRRGSDDEQQYNDDYEQYDESSMKNSSMKKSSALKKSTARKTHNEANDIDEQQGLEEEDDGGVEEEQVGHGDDDEDGVVDEVQSGKNLRESGASKSSQRISAHKNQSNWNLAPKSSVRHIGNKQAVGGKPVVKKR